MRKPGRPRLNPRKVLSTTERYARLARRRQAAGIKQITIWVPEIDVRQFRDAARRARALTKKRSTRV